MKRHQNKRFEHLHAQKDRNKREDIAICDEIKLKLNFIV